GHPLQLTAGEFGRAPVAEPGRPCHPLQCRVSETGPAAASADAEVAQGLGQGRPDRVLRVERRIRVLMHELDGGPELPQPGPARTCPTPPAAGAGAGELGGIESADAQPTGLRGEEPGQGSARRRLARPRFADDAVGGAAADGEADVLDADDLII